VGRVIPLDQRVPRLGVFGGTFDPPHVGHLILAETACDTLGLAAVLFVLAADPPHKQNLSLTAVEHRLAMLHLAIAENPRFTASDVDITRPGPHYTVDMLRVLQERHPDAELYFLLGGDSLRDIPTWRDPAGVIAQAYLAAVGRPGSTIDEKALEAKLPGITERLAFLDAPEIGVSATMIRDRLHKGHSIRYLLPEAVERYIVEHQLYRNSS